MSINYSPFDLPVAIASVLSATHLQTIIIIIYRSSSLRVLTIGIPQEALFLYHTPKEESWKMDFCLFYDGSCYENKRKLCCFFFCSCFDLSLLFFMSLWFAIVEMITHAVLVLDSFILWLRLWAILGVCCTELLLDFQGRPFGSIILNLLILSSLDDLLPNWRCGISSDMRRVANFPSQSKQWVTFLITLEQDFRK
jgi:hypothetical protein